MKIIYISSNLHTRDGWVLNINLYNLGTSVRRVVELGALPCNPHAMGLPTQGGQAPALREGLLELLRRCDAVLALDGWEASAQAREEVAEANQHGIAVFFESSSPGWDELQAFVGGRKMQAA